MTNGFPTIDIEGDGTPHGTTVSLNGKPLFARSVTYRIDAEGGASLTIEVEPGQVNVECDAKVRIVNG